MRAQRKLKGRIFVIGGPSGSGKTTLRDKLFKDKELRGRVIKSVSLTTRKKRSAEINGRDYFFITRQEFLRLLKAKKILEWTRYLGYYYATQKDLIERELAEGRSVILCLDLKGASRIKRLYPKNSTTIFILPPSLAILRKRIELRCSRTKQEEIGERIKLARQELRSRWQYDFTLVNEDLAKAVRQLKVIVLKELNITSRPGLEAY